jgi:DNA-binding response OmpR family regulator
MPDDTIKERGMPVVLVIDDDRGVLDSLMYVLEAQRYRVVTAPNGRRGLDAFRKHEPDAVITDIIMPEEDGLAVIREMRRLNPRTKIIAISGGGKVDKSDYLTIAEKLGADIGITKADLGTLFDVLAKLLA